jgi:hypothetical protein
MVIKYTKSCIHAQIPNLHEKYNSKYHLSKLNINANLIIRAILLVLGNIMKKYIKQGLVALLVVSFAQGDTFSMDTVVSTYLDLRNKSLSAVCSVSNPVIQRIGSVGNIPAVKSLSNITVDPTQGLKACLALLGFWSVPLMYNLALWQFKKK